MTIEADLTNDIDFEEIIAKFAKLKYPGKQLCNF